jgi:Tol biopolymer transport system component
MQHRLTDNNFNEGALSWSSFNDQITFSSMREEYLEIYVMNSDGSQQTRVTFNKGNSSSPAWSADGKCIAYVSSTAISSAIYIMTSDGLKQTRLTHDQDSALPAWQP